MDKRLNSDFIDLFERRSKDVPKVFSLKLVNKRLIALLQIHLPDNTVLINLKT